MTDREIELIQFELSEAEKKNDVKKISELKNRLYDAHLRQSNEYMKKYHPSIDGLKAVLEDVKKYKMKQYKIVDPVAGHLRNGFDSYLGHFLSTRLVSGIERLNGYAVYDLELKDLIDESIKNEIINYGFTNVKIRIESLMENRPKAGAGRRYIVSFIF